MEEIEVLKRKLLREQEARKQAEEIIEQKSLELYLANQELHNFAQIVAHDLKAPLRNINTLAEWLNKDYAQKLDDAGKEYLQTMVNRTNTLNNLIDVILAYAKAGRMALEKTSVDLNQVVSEIIQLLAPPENIKIEIPKPLPVIYCNELDITQILQNLISNAIKYLDKPDGRITITYTQTEQVWQIAVTDNGEGIEEKYFELIFKLFQTLSTAEEKDSTGVGLSIVKKIVEANNGRIWVESALGKGSTFYFTIPK